MSLFIVNLIGSARFIAIISLTVILRSLFCFFIGNALSLLAHDQRAVHLAVALRPRQSAHLAAVESILEHVQRFVRIEEAIVVIEDHDSTTGCFVKRLVKSEG